MDQPLDERRWWELHVRKVRGETLSPTEEQLYEAELARHDQEAPPLRTDLEALRQMRDQVSALARDNSALRGRLSELEKEIQRVEASLSPETRHALGVR